MSGAKYKISITRRKRKCVKLRPPLYPEIFRWLGLGLASVPWYDHPRNENHLVCMVFRIEAFDQGESGGKGWSASVTRSNRKIRIHTTHASMVGLLVIIPTRQYSAHAASHHLGHETREAKFIL